MRGSVDEAYIARIAASYPGGRLGQPEDALSFAAFLCSDAASNAPPPRPGSVPLVVNNRAPVRIGQVWPARPARTSAVRRDCGRALGPECDNDAMSRRGLRSVLIVVGVITGVTLIARRLGYNLGGNTVVRCRQGHLFTTIWIPGVKLKELDLVVARVQRCPVGKHWSLVFPVRDVDLTDEERQFALAHHDIRLP
jgi:hypothetical protein